MASSLVVKLTTGTAAAERCADAFTVAAAAAARAVPVTLWLAGEASWFALPGKAETFDLPESRPLADLLASVLKAGTVTLCADCAARRGIGRLDVIEGIGFADHEAFLDQTLADGAAVLVY